MIITSIERAMIEAIKAAHIIPGDEVKSYAGEFDEDVFDTIRKMPAAWVTFGGTAKPKRFGARSWRYDATFVTIVAARSVMSESAAREGSPSEPGAYQLLSASHKVLLNQDLGLPIREFQPGAIKTLLNTRLRNDAIAAYTQEWHTAWVEQMPPEAGLMWLRTGLNYYLKPGDEDPDASDVIELAEAA